MPLEVTMAESSDSYLHEPDEWIGGLIVDIQEAPGDFGPQFKWIIELDGQDEGDFDQWAYCSQTLSPRSKLYSWLSALDPENIPQIGGTVNVAQYKDRRCQVMFERYMGTDRNGLAAEKEKIVKIRAEKTQTAMQKKQGETKAARAPKRETTDFANPDEAPF